MTNVQARGPVGRRKEGDEGDGGETILLCALFYYSWH